MRLELPTGVGRGALDAWALQEGARLVDIWAARRGAPRRVVYAWPDGSLVTLCESDDRRWIELAGHDVEPLAERARAMLDAYGGPPEREPELPERPRLVSSVLARRHAREGTEESTVILHEWHSNLVLAIDEDSFAALELADGTRDRDALCLALARRGLYRGEADLVQLLEELHGQGVLTDGLEMPSPAAPVEAPSPSLDRPLDVLPGFTLVCDGSGSCCRFYGSVAFTPRDAAHARVVAEDLRLPIAHDALFTPLRGAQLEPDGTRAVALIDGRCAFLEHDGRCGIHRRAGAEAKPFPCRFYPAMLMDDGTSVRVSLGPECACIFASVGRTDGEPLVPTSARTLADLEPGIRVMHVPDPVPLSATRTAARAELAAWSRALVETCEEGDAVAFAWALADALPHEGLALETLARARSAAPPHARTVAPWIAALSARAAAAAEAQESWRSASDLSRRVARWIADALAQARLSELLAGPPDAASERFYLRALAHGHRLSVEGRTLSHGLRDRATRLLAARAMARVPGLEDTSAPYPLALLEAAMRNLGIAGYADAL
jgi:lysine-N-methylase